jgi:hypothetical protein
MSSSAEPTAIAFTIDELNKSPPRRRLLVWPKMPNDMIREQLPETMAQFHLESLSSCLFLS